MRPSLDDLADLAPMIWHQFEEAAPELAELGRQRFEATHVALLGTVRRDGSPRISPIEPYLVLDHLLLGMLAGSNKARDLARDPRCTLHSAVSDVNGSEGEFKLHGRALLVTDPALLHGEYEAWWTADDASPSRVFSFDITSAAHIAWDIEKGKMTVRRWSPELGFESTVRAY
jgi:predicted pyridoxine 5'-phosphate oxidase superfamily flavin-nucleotide-binding protein